MRITFSWLRELVDLPPEVTAHEVAERLIARGFEVEGIETVGGDVTGPLVVGRVMNIEELDGFKKPIRFCQVAVGSAHGGVRGIVCGARNFETDDVIVVALPGAVLPGGFEIAARETYGRISDGMICSERELGLSDEHSGILVLDSVSDIGADAQELLGLGDVILDISVNPDRGYAMSARGIAREVAGAYGIEFVDPADHLGALAEPVAGGVPVPVAVESSQCSLFVLRTIRGVNPQVQTPRWMRQRLSAAGMRPVSLVVDVTNYVMLELGQPLHAFDASKVRGPVRVRQALPGETLELIDHSHRILTAADIVIADDAGVLSLAGIMGGVGSEIAADATDVLIEAAHFSSESIAGSCRAHRISTDASRRFERGVDSSLAPFAAHRATQLILELAGGENHGLQAVEMYTPESPIALSIGYVNARTGLTVGALEATAILQSVGCDVTTTTDERDFLVVRAPSWRPDLVLPCDLCEEIARVIGYDDIPATLARPASVGGLNPAQRIRRLRDNTLVGLGWTEVALSPFMASDALDSFGCENDDPRLRSVRLLNPLSAHEPVLRTTLLPALAEALLRNRSRGAEAVALFESSAVHIDHDRQVPPSLPVGQRPTQAQLSEALACVPQEWQVTAGMATGAWQKESWRSRAEQWQWWHALDAAQSAAAVYAQPIHVRTAAVAGWHPGRCAELFIETEAGELLIGTAGELHPRVTSAWGLPARTIAFEIRTDHLAERYSVTPGALLGQALSTTPVLKEDLAFVVSIATSSADVAAAVAHGCGPLLEHIEVFDDYRGEPIPTGFKSIALSLRFRHPERSLRDEEVAELRAAGIARAQSDVAAQLRGA